MNDTVDNACHINMLNAAADLCLDTLIKFLMLLKRHLVIN